MATPADNQIAKTSGYIAKEAGLGFYNSAVLVPSVDTQYSDEFGTVSGGAKVGNSIRVKFPAKFTTTSDVAMSAGSKQAIIEDTVTVTLDTRCGVHGEISSEQATLDIDSTGQEYSKRVLQPMGKALNSKIETLGFEQLAKFSNNSIVLSTPFSDGDVLRKTFVKARALLQKNLCPEGDITAILGSDAELEVSNSVLDLFHSQAEIEKAYKDGKMNQFGGMMWKASNLVYTRVNGAGGSAGRTVTVYAEGGTAMTLSSVANLAVGDKIQFTGLWLVNDESKLPYVGTLLTRSVKAINGSVITIDPIYGSASGARQNASAVPVATQAITIMGTAGKSYLVCPVFQKNAITLATADLILPKAVEMASRTKVNNVAMRYVKAYDIGSDNLPNRYESLLTWKMLRPEWACAVELQLD